MCVNSIDVDTLELYNDSMTHGCTAVVNLLHVIAVVGIDIGFGINNVPFCMFIYLRLLVVLAIIIVLLLGLLFYYYNGVTELM